MVKILRILLMIPMLLMLTGCPMSLFEPIDQPNVPVNASWLGVYSGVVPEDYLIATTVNRWDLSKQSDYEYKITGSENLSAVDMQKNKSMGANAPMDYTYTAHVSIIQDQTFLNVKTGVDGKYYFFKIEKKDKSFFLREISDSWAATVTTADQLKKTIKDHLNKDDLYGLSFTMERK